jgi:hypothetical protein
MPAIGLTDIQPYAGIQNQYDEYNGECTNDFIDHLTCLRGQTL